MNDAITPGTLYCANHPTVETQLRCNRCEKPICPRCAVPTPTGYRCRECVRGQQQVFDTTRWYDYPLAFIIAGGLSTAGSFLATLVGFFVIFLAPVAGVAIAEVVRFVVGRRRSPRLWAVAAIGAALGGLPILLLALIGAITSRGGILSLVWIGLYLFTVTSTVYYRLRGININR